MNIGERIKQRREELGMSQIELAHLMGLSAKSTICKLETQGNNITTDRIRRVAKALNCTPSYLMGWEDTTSSSDGITQAMLKGQQVSKIANNKEVFECASKLLELPPELQVEAFNYVEYLLNRHLLSQAQKQED